MLVLEQSVSVPELEAAVLVDQQCCLLAVAAPMLVQCVCMVVMVAREVMPRLQQVLERQALAGA